MIREASHYSPSLSNVTLIRARILMLEASRQWRNVFFHVTATAIASATVSESRVEIATRKAFVRIQLFFPFSDINTHNYPASELSV